MDKLNVAVAIPAYNATEGIAEFLLENEPARAPPRPPLPAAVVDALPADAPPPDQYWLLCPHVSQGSR